MKLVLLTVTVLGIGGPPGAAPSRLPNATITVGHKGETVAAGTDGHLEVKLEPGVYSVIARLADEPGKPPSICHTTTIRLAHLTRHLEMGCSIE